MLLVLHPVFALTAVADAIIGPMLPSLAKAFHFSDSQSGLLFFSIFAGMATGALLCRGNYGRIMMIGLLALTASCFCFPWIPRSIIYPFAFFFGVSVGAPMTAVSLFAGRNYPAHRASVLTMLNFTWSAGAMLAPLIAARLLAVSSWRSVFVALGWASALASIFVVFTIRDSSETIRKTQETTGLRNLRIVALFALFFFLEVGLETMFGAWITTYVLRVIRTSLTLAAATTAVYWTGFLVSRGLSSLLLLRMNSARLLQVALPLALVASILLVWSRSPVVLIVAILLLGSTLAPIFPVALANFFDRARHSSDSRFVLALSGFGASVFPWLVGSISSHSGSIGTGLIAGPVTLLIMTAMLPFVTARSATSSSALDATADGSFVKSAND
ncbi:MAG TPA: MFS transporter [Terracidiphilus sp.]|nr:MFS transporter [Terracidiphilus sp.]